MKLGEITIVLLWMKFYSWLAEDSLKGTLKIITEFLQELQGINWTKSFLISDQEQNL
jgi:hypothetical protein